MTDTLRHRPGDQPLPTPNGHPAIADLVQADIEARRQIGIQRYGTPLQPHNGRDALRDAYEEALDLACYLRQAIYERDGTSREAQSKPHAHCPVGCPNHRHRRVDSCARCAVGFGEPFGDSIAAGAALDHFAAVRGNETSEAR